MSSTFDIFHMLEDTCINTQKSMNTDININDWVLVNYFGEFFPRKLIDLEGDTVCVSCLQKAGNYFKYPITTGKYWYPVSYIFATLHEPELKTTRGFYSYLIKKKMK